MSTQKKIRDLERLIKKKSGFDPNIDELKSKLQSLQDERQSNLLKLKEKKFSTKYHMIKFFERRKLTRKIFQNEKLIQKLDNKNSTSDKEKKSSIENEIKELYDKLTYVLYYPKAKKYVSLFADDQMTATALNKKQKKMLVLAKEARNTSIEEGEEDRVEHAMQVEREGNSSGKKKVARKEKRLKRITMDDEEEEEEEAGVMEETSDSDEESESEEDEEMALAKAEAAKLSSGSDEDSSDEGEDSSDDEEEEEGAQKKPQPKPTTQPKAKVPTPAAPVVSTADYHPDPFFLEEADGDTSGVPDALPIRGGKLGRGGFNRRGGGRGGGGISSGKPLSKQESRLRNWQSGARGGGRAGGGRDRFGERGREFEGKSDSSSGGGKRRFESDGQEDSQGGRPSKQSRGEGQSKDSSGRGRGGAGAPAGRAGRGGAAAAGRGRGGGRGGGRGRGESTQQPRLAWEEGGGVSAQSITERTKQKLSGAIVSGGGAGKKITFD